MYKFFFRHVLVYLNPEWVHLHAIDCLELAGKLPAMRHSVSRQVKRPEKRFTWPLGFSKRKTLGPLDLAAGMDKEARAVSIWDAPGLGFVEIGAITPLAQPGNKRPRLQRISAKHTLRNAMGFNNEDAREATRRLRRLRARYSDSLITGANIGKNKVTPPEKAPSDCRKVIRSPARLVDLLVINVSSPNIPGLRDLQAVSSLELVVQAVQTELTGQNLVQLPVFVKITPDLVNNDIMAVTKLAEQSNLTGVVVTNTTIQRDLERNGVSGEPLRECVLEVMTLLRKHLSPKKTIVRVGGITTTADTRAMLDAGANLVGGLSAFIYEGPGWAARLNRQLVSAARSRGASLIFGIPGTVLTPSGV